MAFGLARRGVRRFPLLQSYFRFLGDNMSASVIRDDECVVTNDEERAGGVIAPSLVAEEMAKSKEGTRRGGGDRGVEFFLCLSCTHLFPALDVVG